MDRSTVVEMLNFLPVAVALSEDCNCEKISVNKMMAQIMRTVSYRSVHVKSFEARRARALLGARARLVGMITWLSKYIRGVLKTLWFAARRHAGDAVRPAG